MRFNAAVFGINSFSILTTILTTTEEKKDKNKEKWQ